MTDELTCAELVELVTDYLDGRLPDAERARFEAHLDDCDGCQNHLGQVVTLLRVAASARDPQPPPAVDALVHAFRDWRRGRAAS